MQQQDIHQFIEIPVDPAFTVCFPVCLKPDQFMDQITDRIMFPFRFGAWPEVNVITLRRSNNPTN